MAPSGHPRVRGHGRRRICLAILADGLYTSVRPGDAADIRREPVFRVLRRYHAGDITGDEVDVDRATACSAAVEYRPADNSGLLKLYGLLFLAGMVISIWTVNLSPGVTNQRFAHRLPGTAVTVAGSAGFRPENEIRPDDLGVDGIRVARTHAVDDRLRLKTLGVRNIELGVLARDEVRGGERIARASRAAIVPVGTDIDEEIAAFPEQAIPEATDLGGVDAAQSRRCRRRPRQIRAGTRAAIEPDPGPYVPGDLMPKATVGPALLKSRKCSML